MGPFANGISLEIVLDMLKRRLWVALFLFSAIVSATAALALFLPDVFTATALIVVEGQQVPNEYVRSTVTMDVERRLQTISQEILSRSELEKVIDQFGLYTDLKQQQASPDAIAAVMRRDIGILIKGKSSGLSRDTLAFEVNYTGPDPQKVMQVANTIASSYIEGNLKSRGEQALGTTEFLRSELERVKKRLDEQEGQVAEFKQKYMGELPEQLQANLGTLTLLQKQMEITAMSLTQAQERRSLLLQDQREQRALEMSQNLGKAAETSERLMELDKSSTSIEGLRKMLAQLQVRFSEKHPDVIRMKQLIAAMEEQQPAQSSLSGTNGQEPASSFSPSEIEKHSLDLEIKKLSAELNRIRQEIPLYQQRIENTPKREQEFVAISRDYETTKALYNSLLKRLDEANIADSLEQRQKAERFRLLEPAAYPQVAAGPKRPLLSLLGVALALGAAGASVLLRELLDSSLHRIEDVKALAPVRILGSIPRIVTERERRAKSRRRYLGVVSLAVLIVAIFSGASWVALKNEGLVRQLVKPPSGMTLR